MKRFSENINENQKHYSNDLKLYNEIYDLINEHLNPKMDGEDSDKINIIGKEDLVKELSKIVDNQVIKEKINFFKKIEKNPKLIIEAKTYKEIESDMKIAYDKIIKTIDSCKTEEQLDSCKAMIDNFYDRFISFSDDYNAFTSRKMYLDVTYRQDELNEYLNRKRKMLKEDKIDENFNSDNQKVDMNIITNFCKELSSEIKIINDNTKMFIKLNDLTLDIDIKPTNIKVLKNNEEKFNLTNIKELKDFIKTEIEKIK